MKSNTPEVSFKQRFYFRQRNCIFKEINFNESALDLMAKNEMDFSIRGAVFTYQGADSPVEFSKPISLYSFHVAQFLNEPTTIRSDLSSFLNENKLLIFCVLIGYVVPLFAVSVFSSRIRHVHRSIRALRTIAPKPSFLLYNPVRAIAPNPLFLRYKRVCAIAPKLLFLRQNRMRTISPKLAIIFVFFRLFIFIIRTMLTNLINTNAVVLDTSQFIDSRQRLFRSSETMVTCGKPLATDLESRKSTEKSFNYKLFSQKVKEGRLVESCNSKEDWKRLIEIESKGNRLTNLFFFMNRAHMFYILSFFSTRKEPFFIYMGRESYREDSVALRMRKNLQFSIKRDVSRR